VARAHSLEKLLIFHAEPLQAFVPDQLMKDLAGPKMHRFSIRLVHTNIPCVV
jgi:hypothetical protein